MRDLSLLSISVHIINSEHSFSEFKSFSIFSDSSIAFLPLLIVPEIGHVSIRLSVTLTNISGEAPTKNSDLPKFIKKL